MPYNIALNNLPAGISLTFAKKGEKVKIAFREFTSSEDGDLFIQRLEGILSNIFSSLPTDVKPSTIDHILVVIQPDKSATVYVNELTFILQIRAKRAIKDKGELIFQDDIAEIESLSFTNEVDINDKNMGIIFVFSIGWRKGLFFDFGAFQQPPVLRSYDTERLFGYYFAYLSFQHLFKLTDSQWEKLFTQKWFPFTGLKSSTVQKMLSYIKSDIPVDDLLDNIVNEVQSSTSTMLQRWQTSPILKNHLELINRSVERYLQKDYISATTILYTRIEGVMRDVLAKLNSSKKHSAKNLSQTITAEKESSDIGMSLLLPRMFHKYLDEVYFLGFEPGKVAEISRHSVAHGVANPDNFSAKAATIGLLILDQLFFFLPSEKS